MLRTVGDLTQADFRTTRAIAYASIKGEKGAHLQTNSCRDGECLCGTRFTARAKRSLNE